MANLNILRTEDGGLPERLFTLAQYPNLTSRLLSIKFFPLFFLNPDTTSAKFSA